MATKTARPAAPVFSAKRFSRLVAGRSDWEICMLLRDKTGKRLSPASIYSYRRGAAVPSYDNAAALAAALGVSLDELGE